MQIIRTLIFINIVKEGYFSAQLSILTKSLFNSFPEVCTSRVPRIRKKIDAEQTTSPQSAGLGDTRAAKAIVKFKNQIGEL